MSTIRLITRQQYLDLGTAGVSVYAAHYDLHIGTEEYLCARFSDRKDDEERRRDRIREALEGIDFRNYYTLVEEDGE